MRVAKVFPTVFESGKLLGFADIIFSLTDGGNGCLTIRGYKIFKGNNGGIQLGLPSKKDDQGEYRPLVSMDFENEDAKAFMDHVTNEVAKAYAAAVKAKKNGETTNSVNSSNTSSVPSPSGGGIDDDDIPF